MAIFEAAIGTVLKHEGGYVDDPRDKGGETYRGISRRFHPEWPGWEKIDEYKSSLTGKKLIAAINADQQLLALTPPFYKANYWSRFGEIYDQDIATKVFDMGVLCGIKTSVKALQNAVCACGHLITVDGIIGQGTLCATNAIPPGELLSTLRDEYVEHFHRIIEKDPSQKVFEHDWIERALS